MVTDQSNFAKSSMNTNKIHALVVKGLIQDRSSVAWKEAAGQYIPSGEEGKIAVFQAYCECGFRVPSHPFLAAVLEDFW